MGRLSGLGRGIDCLPFKALRRYTTLETVLVTHRSGLNAWQRHVNTPRTPSWGLLRLRKNLAWGHGRRTIWEVTGPAPCTTVLQLGSSAAGPSQACCASQHPNPSYCLSWASYLCLCSGSKVFLFGHSPFASWTGQDWVRLLVDLTIPQSFSSKENAFQLGLEERAEQLCWFVHHLPPWEWDPRSIGRVPIFPEERLQMTCQQLLLGWPKSSFGFFL